MPKRSANPTGFPRDPDTCFASRHLSATHYKVFSVIVACAYSKRREREGNDATGPLIFNASIKPWLCNAVPVSQNYAHIVIDQLLTLGWLILVKEGARRDNGQQAPNEYRVVEHDEFVAAHPGSCPPNMFAPDGKTAEAFGVGYGDRFGGGIIPRNFWPSEDTFEGAALRKFLSDDAGGTIITDEEIAAVRKLYSAVTLTRETAAGTLTRETAEASRPHSSVTAVPTVRVKPSPQFGDSRPHNSGENLYTASGTASTHNTHTTPATAIVDKVAKPKTAVCDVLEKNQSLNDADAENEVAALLTEFVAQNNGEAGKCTFNQRRLLKQLALRHGRKKFRDAARAWFADPPWNSRTTDPFLTLIAGFEGYAAKKAHAEKQKATRANEKVAVERSTLLHCRKAFVAYGQLNPEFLASLTQEDRDYIKQVADTDTPEAMPPDNGRNFQSEEIEFRKRQTEPNVDNF
jgi:hypothetical protein